LGTVASTRRSSSCSNRNFRRQDELDRRALFDAVPANNGSRQFMPLLSVPES
jgi:hypothetical protein